MNTYYGYPENKLSIRQLIKVIRFQELVEPWLTENLSAFDDKWHVAMDSDTDSFRVYFDDIETETWFKLAWLQGGKVEYEDKYKND